VKVGVTGGAGFIGRWVTDELLQRGHHVVVFDPRGRPTDRLRRDVEMMLGDVRDDVAVTELAAHVDGIIHLAAVLGTQETIRNPRPAVMSNVQGGLNVLEALTQYQLPGVNICVGNHWMDNSYSISKTAVERLGHMFRDERGTWINQVRVVNAYGAFQSAAPPFGSAKVRKIMPAFICRALTGRPIEVYGDGGQVSDCVHVTDVAKALVTALEKAAAGIVFDQVVEVGPAEHHTVNDVAHRVAAAAAELTGQPAVEVQHLPMRPGEIPGARVTADHSTLRLVDMHPDQLVPLGAGVTQTVEWFHTVRGVWWHG
jgi:nucleoside-diphosphate-sugar epimerase